MIELLVALAVSTLPSAAAPVAELAKARDLLLARKYDDLIGVVEARQRAATADPARADELHWTANAFRLTDQGIPGAINEWVAARPTSWVPLFARAVNSGARADLARGTEWMSLTSADQFRRMAELNTAMAGDCRKVLSLNPAACGCYVEMVGVLRHGVFDREPITTQAFQACPRDYTLHFARIFGLTPRWGGSYEEMGSAIEFARRSGLSDAQVKSLEGYTTIDRALVLESGKKMGEALRILDQAIAASPTALLFEVRAELNSRRGDARSALRDANAALDLSRGGWMFRRERFKRLLIVRAWALHNSGRTDEARTDVALATQVMPEDEAVKEWQLSLSKAAAQPK